MGVGPCVKFFMRPDIFSEADPGIDLGCWSGALAVSSVVYLVRGRPAPRHASIEINGVFSKIQRSN